MLRAVIEKDGVRAYFDFCKTWESLEKAVHKIVQDKHICEIKMENEDIHVHITKSSDDIYSKVQQLIQPTDKIYDIYFICKKLQYDDINFHDEFLNNFNNFQSVNDARKSYIDYSHDQYNQRSQTESESRYKNPMNLIYEPMKLYGIKVLFTDWRVDEKLLPKGIHRYEVREEGGDMCQLGYGIWCNHYGTILSSKAIRLDEDGYRSIDEVKDVQYSEEPSVSLKQYINETKQKEKHYPLR